MSIEKVIKYHLLFFEVISILTLLHGISHLVYYSVIMRFVVTNDFNSMIKAKVNFTYNYKENKLFDVQFNISDISFELLSSKEINKANSIEKSLNYEDSISKSTSIYDDKSHEGIIIVAKKYFDLEIYKGNLTSESYLTVENFNYDQNTKQNDYISNKNFNPSNANFNIKDNNNNFNLKDNNQNSNYNNNINLDPNLAIIKNKGIESCFLFSSPSLAVDALNILFETNELLQDNWNTIIFIVIILFFFFMKVNILFELIKTLIKFKFELFPNLFQLKNFYVYIIFNGSLIFIIPLLYFGYDDYKFDFCLGFSDAYFNSFLADRQIFMKRQKEFFDPYQRDSRGEDDENLNFKNSLFFVHDANRNTNNLISRFGYLKNMLFLCVFVWLSGMRNIFKHQKLNERNNKSEENDLNNSSYEADIKIEQETTGLQFSKRKKALKYLKNILLISIFSLYATFGILNFFDICKLTYFQISNNSKFLFTFQIFFKLFSFVMYFYLYSFMIIISIYHKYKASKAKKMEKIRDIRYKEIEDNNSIINLDKEETNNHSIVENNEFSNTFDEENFKLDNKDMKSYCNFYNKINEEANLIIDKQATMQILKEESIDSESENTMKIKKNEFDLKKLSIDTGEIKFKKSNISLIKHNNNEKNLENNINKNSNINISLESHDKNQNDEEYNKVFFSNLTEN